MCMYALAYKNRVLKIDNSTGFNLKGENFDTRMAFSCKKEPKYGHFERFLGILCKYQSGNFEEF